MDLDYSADDNLPLSVLGKVPLKGDPEARRLLEYAQRLRNVFGTEKDMKAKEAIAQVKTYIDGGLNPIVYCRYIHTAKYLGTVFQEQLNDKKYKSLHIEVITSELNDELRKEKIELMNSSQRRLLIATDCLSEGINLQDGFNAILHYDLPWNPNRLEQREGRIDRFGQRSTSVEVTLLYGSNNPIDGVVLEVLLRKAREIRRSIGISIPFPENSASVMEAVTNAILLKPHISIMQQEHQLTLFEAEEINAEKNKVAKAFDEAEKRERVSRSIFAQNTIKPSEIEEDLKEVDEAIGDVKAVEQFVIESLRFLGVQVDELKGGYRIHTINIPQRIRGLLTDKNEIIISFLSPTPPGFKYIGRNHPFTEHLSQFLINSALNGVTNSAARAAVIRCRNVDKKTVLFQFRVRNVIAEQRSNKEIVAEEMWLWGYTGALSDKKFIGKDNALTLLMSAKATQNLEFPEQQYWLDQEMNWVRAEKTFREITDPVAYERSSQLVASHTRFRKLVNGDRYKVVEPVLPMDVLGIYILLPEVN
jgi:superfamily II DNA helicase RecQ